MMNLAHGEFEVDTWIGDIEENGEEAWDWANEPTDLGSVEMHDEAIEGFSRIIR